MGGRIHYTEQRNKEEMSFSRLPASAEAASSPLTGLPSLEGRGAGRAVTEMSGFWQQAHGNLFWPATAPPCTGGAASLSSGFLSNAFPSEGDWRNRNNITGTSIAQSRALVLRAVTFSKGVSHHHPSWLAFSTSGALGR